MLSGKEVREGHTDDESHRVESAYGVQGPGEDECGALISSGGRAASCVMRALSDADDEAVMEARYKPCIVRM